MRLIDTIGPNSEDVKSSDHDEMCFSVVKHTERWEGEETLDRLRFKAKFLQRNWAAEDVERALGDATTFTTKTRRLRWEYEKPIVIADRMVGFLDLWMEFESEGPQLIRPPYDKGPILTTSRRAWHIGIEVKPRILSAGAVVRQVKLYEHLTSTPCHVAAYTDDPKERALRIMWAPKIIWLKRSAAATVDA